MHAFMFADLLGLGHSSSSLGYTLALVLVWFVCVPAIASIMIGYAVVAVLAERRENQARMAAYDERHRVKTPERRQLNICWSCPPWEPPSVSETGQLRRDDHGRRRMKRCP